MVGRVRAVDADAGANAQVRYRLRNATDRAGLEAFGVDARSGQIRVRTSEGLDKDRSVSGISLCSSLLKSSAPCYAVDGQPRQVYAFRNFQSTLPRPT